MWNYLWPVLLVVGANTFYNIVAKSTPGQVNAFASLFLTYLVAAAISLVLFLCTAPEKNLLTALGKANWTSVAFGVAIVGLEVGYLHLYRAGWKVSTGSLVANLALACVLLLVGLLLYREAISPKQVIGMVLCALGLILVTG